MLRLSLVLLCFCYSSPISLFLTVILSLSLCMSVLQGVWGLTFTFARVFVRAFVDGPVPKPPTPRNHTLCSPCSHAHLCRVTTASTSSPGDWALSVGLTCSTTWVFQSHHHVPARRFLCLKLVTSVTSANIWAIILPLTWQSSVCFPPRRAPSQVLTEPKILLWTFSKHSSH